MACINRYFSACDIVATFLRIPSPMAIATTSYLVVLVI
jgi:hypothetical protein